MQSEFIIEKQFKKAVEQALKEIPTGKMSEVLDFVLFLKKRWAEEKPSGVIDQESTSITLHTMPASHLNRLTGLVGWWGGDADTEF